jgi:hypothetical protein
MKSSLSLCRVIEKIPTACIGAYSENCHLLKIIFKFLRLFSFFQRVKTVELRRVAAGGWVVVAAACRGALRPPWTTTRHGATTAAWRTTASPWWQTCSHPADRRTHRRSPACSRSGGEKGQIFFKEQCHEMDIFWRPKHFNQYFLFTYALMVFKFFQKLFTTLYNY